jgi:hypothetical protein
MNIMLKMTIQNESHSFFFLDVFMPGEPDKALAVFQEMKEAIDPILKQHLPYSLLLEVTF